MSKRATTKAMASNGTMPDSSSSSSTSAVAAAAPYSQPQFSKQKLLLSADTGHFSLIRALHLADLLTELNGFCGVMSIFTSLRYCLGDPSNTATLYWALAFLPFGLFFDFMDGKVARWRKKSSMMGQELDSLADLVCLFFSPRPSIPLSGGGKVPFEPTIYG